jgi:hypothetical protein
MWSSVAVRNGIDGLVGYLLPRTMWMSVVSFARAAGVTGLPSKIRSWIVSTSLVLADMSMMSTSFSATMRRMISRNSARLRYLTSPGCDSGERPGRPMDRAMSASLASARMKSLQPCGSAWMRASLTSSDFAFMSQPTLDQPCRRLQLLFWCCGRGFLQPFQPIHHFQEHPDDLHSHHADPEGYEARSEVCHYSPNLGYPTNQGEDRYNPQQH